MAEIDTNCMTLTRFVLEEQKRFPHAKGDLTILLQCLQTAIKTIQNAVRRAGISHLYVISDPLSRPVLSRIEHAIINAALDFCMHF